MDVERVVIGGVMVYRIFPRRTRATPDDPCVVVGRGPRAGEEPRSAAARERLEAVCKIGMMPMAMLFNRDGGDEWKKFQREWAHPILVGQKMKSVRFSL